MSGAIKREQGETFASFAARQKQVQVQERAEHNAMIRNERTKRQARNSRTREVSDFDYSMNH